MKHNEAPNCTDKVSGVVG